MRLDLFVQLKYESILFVGIRYSMRDLLFDLSNYAWPANWRYAPDMVNDVRASLASVCLSELWILNDLLDGNICTNFFYFHIFFSSVFKHDFITCVDFTRIAASNMTYYITQRIFSTNYVYSFAHFVVEIDDKSSLNGGFYHDLMMIRDTATLYM